MFERKRAQPQTKASLQSREENDPRNQWKGDQRREAAIPAQGWGVKEESRKRRWMSGNSSLGCPVIAQGCPSPACLFVRLFLFCVPPKSNLQTAVNQFRLVWPLNKKDAPGIVFFFFFNICSSWNHWFSSFCCRTKKNKGKKNQIKRWKF